jgi:hypothetical protein
MPKIKYSATDANGLVHTRTSARVYTHMVVARPSYANAVASASAPWMSTAKSNFKYYSDIISGREDARFTSVERATEELGGATTLARYVEILIERALAAVEKSKAEGRYDRFFDKGWCGRPDLADKLAAKARSEGYAEVAILEAVAK